MLNLLKNKISYSLLLLLLLTPLSTFAKKDIQEFKIPDIRDDYCGVNINFQYCKCAFHGEYCESINLSEKEADKYVREEYKKWVKGEIIKFANNCINNKGGTWDKDKRTCAIEEDKKIPDGPFNLDCSINTQKFKDWEKYSDFDKRIPLSEASWEVKQFDETLNKIADKIAEADQIEYEMELDRLMRLELRNYKNALVKNIRNNITKAIFRLTWMTYNVTKPVKNSSASSIAKGYENSYSKLFTSDSSIQKIGATFKFIQSGVPKGSKAEIQTKTTSGKIKSIALNATLETIESIADPKAIAMQIYTDLSKTTMDSIGVPKLEFTKEEVAILKNQHITNEAINEILSDSYKENALRRVRLLQIEQDISKLYNKLQEWKEKEYNRVKNSLENSCKENLEK